MIHSGSDTREPFSSWVGPACKLSHKEMTVYSKQRPGPVWVRLQKPVSWPSECECGRVRQGSGHQLPLSHCRQAAWGRAARAPPGCRRKSRDRKEAGSCPVDQILEAKQAGDTHTALWKPPGMQLAVQESLWGGGRGGDKPRHFQSPCLCLI